jgi:translation initiation factor IF-2
MSQRLVKIAKELNVGTATIVEFLTSTGYEIENKPTAKVTDDMYDDLVKEFSSSIAVKEQADQMMLGGRLPGRKPEAEVVTEVEPPKPIEVPKPIVPEKEEVIAEEKEEVEKPVTIEEDDKPKLKVVGKIDLDADKKKKEVARKKKAEENKKKEAEEKASGKEEEKEVEEVIKEDQAAEQKSDDQESTTEEDGGKRLSYGTDVPEEIVRAETPQLKGLKILGKIDAEKLAKKKPKKEVKPAQNKAGSKPAAKDDPSKRRRRKRKKVSAADMIRQEKASNRRNRKKEEPTKEVSQKEIDDKIKATMARLAGNKSKRQKIRRESRKEKAEKQELIDEAIEQGKLQLTEFISVSELASLLDTPVAEVIMTCMNLGVIVSINQRLDAEIIELVAEEFGHEVEFISAEEKTLEDIDDEEDDPADLRHRAPIVTVMGHVDHGKTSLLDFIREANVVGGEAGGITQHIGAYEVKVGPEQKRITFLDTPGHEAFTAMRARGAKVTDVAVIIIAADDRVMPQTKEAISHAQAAGVPIVFAINKVDKPGADPEKIKQELASMNFLVESWGGQYQSQDISAKTGMGIEQLLEKIVLESELLELKANPARNSIGAVIEASLDKGRGYVTKLLVQNGTLNVGDIIVAGEHSGKVKAMFNERGKRIKLAGPSSPVLVLGLDGAPQAGEKFKEFDSEQDARKVASQRAQISREQSNRASKRISLDEIGRRLALGTFKELNLIVKGDVDGSIEALSDSLIKLSIDTIQVNVIHKAVGQIAESDVLLASASDAIIIGFQVRPSLGARKLAEKEGVEVKLYSIIYEAIDEVKSAIEGMLEPTKEEKITGQVEVRETYKISKIGTIAGCYVQEGKVSRNSLIRIVRDGIVIYPTREGVVGEIATLKRFKDDVKEVKAGIECGITIKNFNDIKVGDYIESYLIEEIQQTLD